ncbi:sigma-70 family RNA polymerase sigma factor [Acetobacter musti]|uniref:Sigma-70 family RNA polymerase sigma factor n=1 Tax=Acetobacter musti TaxID=864732 RepID=A0ABX0JR05_9PROT|nr:sigma-70 family RNA polymerase sigma factor [Acetobacter musti]NHN85757.1 sigma-70 family RNA polymerase sigma factor [Acetobacter musti]
MVKESEPVLDVYLRHCPKFVDVAASITGCRTRAEDIVQDAFLKVTAARQQNITIERPFAYLMQVVRRLAIDGLRGAKIRKAEDIADIAIRHLLSDPLTPEAYAGDREELALIEQTLASLPERTRLAFEMKRFGGYKLREIAAELDISIVRAAQLVNEAMTACQAALDETAPKTDRPETMAFKIFPEQRLYHQTAFPSQESSPKGWNSPWHA